jgi:DNA-binding MurR/RpiR family transcriptional regulator
VYTLLNVRSVVDQVLGSLDQLTPAQRNVGRWIVQTYPSGSLRSAAVIAEEAHASPASVIRFVRKLGFAGLAEFQATVRDELVRRSSSPFKLESLPVPESSFVERVLDAEMALVRDTLGRLSEETLAQVRAILTSASKVFVYGGRFSQAVSHYLYAHLELFLGDVHHLAASTTPLSDRIVSAGRSTALVVFDFRRYDVEAEFAAQYMRGKRSQIIVVTDQYLSPAARHADVTLITAVERPELCDSYTGAIALCDVIVTSLLSHDRTQRVRMLDQIEQARSEFAALQVSRAVPDFSFEATMLPEVAHVDLDAPPGAS